MFYCQFYQTSNHINFYVYLFCHCQFYIINSFVNKCLYTIILCLSSFRFQLHTNLISFFQGFSERKELKLYSKYSFKMPFSGSLVCKHNILGDGVATKIASIQKYNDHTTTNYKMHRPSVLSVIQKLLQTNIVSLAQSSRA